MYYQLLRDFYSLLVKAQKIKIQPSEAKAEIKDLRIEAQKKLDKIEQIGVCEILNLARMDFQTVFGPKSGLSNSFFRSPESYLEYLENWQAVYDMMPNLTT